MAGEDANRLYMVAAGFCYLVVVAATFDAWAVAAVLTVLAGAALIGGAR